MHNLLKPLYNIGILEKFSQIHMKFSSWRCDKHSLNYGTSDWGPQLNKLELSQVGCLYISWFV